MVNLSIQDNYYLGEDYACNIFYFYTSYAASILILGFDSLKRYALRLSFPNHTFYWNSLRLLKQKESVK